MLGVVSGRTEDQWRRLHDSGLKCGVLSHTHDVLAKTVRVLVPECHCPDFTGAVEFARRQGSDVEDIAFIDEASNAVTTRYVRHPTDWTRWAVSEIDGKRFLLSYKVFPAGTKGQFSRDRKGRK